MWLKEAAVGSNDDHNGPTHRNIWLSFTDNGVPYDRKAWASN